MRVFGGESGSGGTLNAGALARVERCAAVISEGGLVAFPTETVYGLGALALNEAAVRRVFEVKGRPANNPLIVHVDSLAMARVFFSEHAWERFGELVQKLAAAFWPGPLTVVMEKAERVPAVVTGGGAMVAVRVPAHAMTLELIRRVGTGVVGPSANRSGHVSPTSAEHVRSEFGDAVEVLDGGVCVGGIESTVIKIGPAVGDGVRVLRPGLISAAAIAEVVGEGVEVVAGAAKSGGERGVEPAREREEGKVTGGGGREREGTHEVAMESPGLLDRHYAPRTRAVMCGLEGWTGVVLSVEAELGGRAVRAGLLTHSELAGRMCVPPPTCTDVLPGDARGYAAGLYGALRRLDEAGLDVIVVHEPPTAGRGAEEAWVWRAIGDRLARATEREG
ncbi:MAG: threonylcarbamoyl-AMP synthase [Phycisphaerales bacterium]|nr:threonylcarbamoyl-AMP synthase [Phycisphaerales bacterium]